MHLLKYLTSCTSTQDEIVEFLLQNDSKFTAIYTFNQTKGRGQYGNSWDDTENQSIAISFGIRQDLMQCSDALFNFYTAVVIRDFLANMTQKEVSIKWPNDMIIAGKKVAGLLCEKRNIASTPYYLVGLGINVLQTDFAKLPKAGSLQSQTGGSYNLEDVAQSLFQYMKGRFEKPVDHAEILSTYQSFLFKKNVISVFEIEKIRQNGIIRSVDEEGYLWVELEHDGMRKFFHKEIEMLY